MNDGSENFTPLTLHESTQNLVGGVCFADATGDGRLDMITADKGRLLLFEQMDLDFGDAPGRRRCGHARRRQRTPERANLDSNSYTHHRCDWMDKSP